MCLYAFILHHTEMLMLSFNLRQLIWSLRGGLLFSAQTFFLFCFFIFFSANQATTISHDTTQMKAQSSKEICRVFHLVIKLEQGAYVTTLSHINEALWNRAVERHACAESLPEHPGKAVTQSPRVGALGALHLIADVSFFRCLGAIFCFISQPGAAMQEFFFPPYHNSCYYPEGH